VIEVTLTHAADAPDNSQRMQHKLGVDVPFNDVRPPIRVLAATLESVVLNMTIQRGPRPEDESTKTTSIAHNPYAVTYDPISHISSTSEVNSLPRTELGDGLPLDTCLWEIEPAIKPPSPLDSDEEEVNSVDSEMLLEADNSDGQTTEHLLNVLDVAIRRAISLSSGPLAKGISVESDKQFTSLSSVAPALFRQNHLIAVASRAIFLPTINKSISATCSRQTKFELTERNASSILHLSTSRLNSNGTNDIAQRNTRSSVHERTKLLSPLLWQTLDRGLLAMKPERRLKPLSVGVGDIQWPSPDEELLEVLSTPETCHLGRNGFDSDGQKVDEELEEEFFSEQEDMLDDRGILSDCGSDFGSDDGDGHDSAEELEWDYDDPFSTCHQDNNDVRYSDSDSCMPIVTARSFAPNTAADVVFEGDSESTYGSLGAISWREDPNAPRSMGSPKNLVISDDDMLVI
jgi:hypothetical protein